MSNIVKRSGLLFVVTCLVCTLASAESAPRAESRVSPGCGKRVSVALGESMVKTLKVGDLDREYRLHLPSGYDPETATPLVLVIHGYTNTAANIEEYTSFSRHADEHDYMVVYPQGTGFEVDGNLVTSWNDLACNVSPGPEGPTCTPTADDYPTPPECGEPQECDWCSCHDDVGFIEELLDSLEGSFCVDLDRIYATGMSNGGMMVQRLGCDLPDRFAAIAPVGGTLARGFNCAPGADPPISLINFYGTRDRTVPFDGSASDDGYFYTPSRQVLAKWAGPDSQRCDSDESPYSTSRDGVLELACVQRANCATGAEVVDCAFDGAHDWPTKGEDQFGVDVIWEFFEKNGR